MNQNQNPANMYAGYGGGGVYQRRGPASSVGGFGPDGEIGAGGGMGMGMGMAGMNQMGGMGGMGGMSRGMVYSQGGPNIYAGKSAF